MSEKSLDRILRKKKKYGTEVLKRTLSNKNKVAYHFNCPDGLVSAALFRYLFADKNLVFIPIDYPLFKEDKISQVLIDANWFAILDLSPFNSNKIDYFFDHHISNEGKEIKAKVSMFDSKSPSGATLIAEYFGDKLPDFMVELSEITKITDTASYSTPAPMEIKDDLSEYDWDERVWLLEDVCKSTFTITEHDLVIEALASKGLDGLWEKDVLDRVRKLRNSRKESFNIAQDIVITDFIILIDDPLHYNTAAIASELQKRGVKGVAYLTVYPEDVKISLRLNRAMPIKDVEKYRVDLLANTMSGGGHKGASGAEMENLDETLEIIKTWTNEVNLNMKIVDLRKK
jgi:oligoribonuclease NrnB/cAMP/cGMP phosphodiesterase (DHH superfamily)